MAGTTGQSLVFALEAERAVLVWSGEAVARQIAARFFALTEEPKHPVRVEIREVVHGVVMVLFTYRLPGGMRGRVGLEMFDRSILRGAAHGTWEIRGVYARQWRSVGGVPAPMQKLDEAALRRMKLSTPEFPLLPTTPVSGTVYVIARDTPNGKEFQLTLRSQVPRSELKELGRGPEAPWISGDWGFGSYEEYVSAQIHGVAACRVAAATAARNRAELAPCLHEHAVEEALRT